MNLRKSLKSIKYVTAAILSTGLIFNTAFMFNTRITAWFTKEFYDKMKVEYKDCKTVKRLLDLAERLQTYHLRVETVMILLDKVDKSFRGNYVNEIIGLYKKENENVRNAIKSLLSANENPKQLIIQSATILENQECDQDSCYCALANVEKALNECKVQKEKLYDAEKERCRIWKILHERMLITTEHLNNDLIKLQDLSNDHLIMCLLLNAVSEMEMDGQRYGELCIRKINESHEHNACEQFLNTLEKQLSENITDLK